MADAIAIENARRIEGQWNWGLWRRWVLVNTIGELIGLGAAAIVGVSLAQTVDTTIGAASGVVLAGALILA